MATTTTVVRIQSLFVQLSGAHDGGSTSFAVVVTSPPVMDLPLLPPVRLAKSTPKKLSDLAMAGKARARPSVTSER